MKQLTTYLKLRGPLFVSAVSLIYMVANTVLVDNRSEFFNSLSVDGQLMLYTCHRAYILGWNCGVM